MKEYELSVLFHPDLEMNLDPALDKVKKLIESNGGEITKEEADGKKRRAYSVGGQDFAIYYFFEVSLPAEAPAKISSALNITDEVLRYLLVRVDERRKKMAPAETEEAEKEADEEIADKTNSKEGE